MSEEGKCGGPRDIKQDGKGTQAGRLPKCGQQRQHMEAKGLPKSRHKTQMESVWMWGLQIEVVKGTWRVMGTLTPQ